MLRSSILLALVLATPALADDTVRLTPVPTGAAEKVGGSLYGNVTLSDFRPATVKLLPPGPSAHPLYGTLPIRTPAGVGVAVVVDTAADGSSRLYVDANGNGDLTDDPAAEWATGPASKRAVAGMKPEALAHVGGATVHLGTADRPFDGFVGLWMAVPRKPATQPTAASAAASTTKPAGPDLHFYRDYYTHGRLTVAGAEHDAYLLDERAAGSFVPTGSGAFVRLFVDLNDNGKLDLGEMFDVAKPMKMRGQVFEATEVSPDGRSFRFGPSDKVAHSPDDVAVGKVAPAFAAVDLAGHDVRFPDAYKGKVVLIDFWATWCVPCMEEVPTVAAAYAKHHEAGFEVVGVSLDLPEDGEKVKRVTAEHKMVWPELFADVGKVPADIDMYSVGPIPSAFLVDGTTGKILASGNDLRGPGLERAVAKVMGDKPAGR